MSPTLEILCERVEPTLSVEPERASTPVVDLEPDDPILLADAHGGSDDDDDDQYAGPTRAYDHLDYATD